MRIAIGGFCHETNSFGNTWESPGIMTSNLELLPFQNADMTYYPLKD